MQDIRIKVEGNKEDVDKLEYRLEKKGIKIRTIFELAYEEKIADAVRWCLENPNETYAIARIIYDCLKGLKIKISSLDTKEKFKIDSNDSEEEIDSKLKEIDKQRKEFNEAIKKKSKEYTKS